MWFFGDSSTDEGRLGRVTPIMWPGVVRADAGITTHYYNYAIGGSFTSNQPSPIFGDESFLGQVNTFVSQHRDLGKNPVAAIETAGNNIWIGAWQGGNPTTIAASALADVKKGVTLLAAAGVHTVDIIAPYDQSLSNAYLPANANTAAVRAAAASASQQYNSGLASLRVDGVTINYFNIASYITYLQRNAAQYGFTQILPLAPGQTCDARCEQTSMFTDDAHVSSKVQELIGNYVASANPIYNNYPMTYGAFTSDVWTAAPSVSSDVQVAQGAWSSFSQGLVDQFAAAHGAPSDPSKPLQAFAYGQIGGGEHDSMGTFGVDRLDWLEPSFTGGASYLVRSDLRIGGAFGFSRATGSLGGSLSADSLEGALFATFDRPNVYVDALFSAGETRIARTRTGSFGSLGSDVSAWTYGATVRAAYLFDLGLFRLGPVAQVSLDRTSLGSFAESGDPLYAIAIGAQSVADLVVDYGVEMRVNTLGRWPVAPFADVMVEHHLLNSPTLSPYFAALPTQTLPGSTIIYPRASLRADTGAEFPLMGAWSGRITGSATTLAGVTSYTINGGVAASY